MADFVDTHSDSCWVAAATYYEALSYYHLEEYDAASALLHELAVADPASNFAAGALYYEGKCAYKSNQFDAAIGIFTQFITVNPSRGFFRSRLFSHWAGTGRRRAVV